MKASHKGPRAPKGSRGVAPKADPRLAGRGSGRSPDVKDTNPKDAIAGNKIPLWLLSPIAKAHWALSQFLGMVKYGAWNWRRSGVRSSVYVSAIDRHLSAWVSGEETDPVDGTHHLGNIMACCGILLDAKAAGKLVDDRPPSVGVRPTYAALEALMPELRDRYKDSTPRHYTIADTENDGAPHPKGGEGRAEGRPDSGVGFGAKPRGGNDA